MSAPSVFFDGLHVADIESAIMFHSIILMAQFQNAYRSKADPCQALD